MRNGRFVHGWLVGGLACLVALSACGGTAPDIGKGTGAGSGAGNGGFSFATDGGSGAGDAGNGCSLAQVACTGGATGYSCPDQSPAVTEAGLSCSAGIMNGFDTDYCCFQWTGGNGACTPEADAPCDENSYGYQCSGTTKPSDVAPQLTCGEAFPDSNGTRDFCCVLH